MRSNFKLTAIGDIHFNIEFEADEDFETDDISWWSMIWTDTL